MTLKNIICQDISQKYNSIVGVILKEALAELMPAKPSFAMTKKQTNIIRPVLV